MGRRRAPYGVAHESVPARLLAIVGVIAMLLCLAGCVGEAPTAEPLNPTLAATVAPSPTGDGPPPPPASSPPPLPLTGPNAQLAQFRQRCVYQTRVLDTAILYFDEAVQLRLSRAYRFHVVLGDVDQPAPDGAGEDQGRLALACTVQARLVTSAQDLDVSPTEWISAKYVPPDATTWTWVVTSKAAGDAQAVLQLKPVIQITRRDGDTSEEDLRTEEYQITFTTDQTATERASSYWTLLVGLAAGLATLIGLWQAVRGLRRRSPKDDRAPSHKA